MALLCFLLLTPSLKKDRKHLEEPLTEPDQRIHYRGPITGQIKLKRGARVREMGGQSLKVRMCWREKVTSVRAGSGPNAEVKFIWGILIFLSFTVPSSWQSLPGASLACPNLVQTSLIFSLQKIPVLK